MVYHTPNVSLNTQLNASGSGLGRFVKAVGRSMVSGESTFITQAVAESDNGNLALAPDTPGQVIALELGEKQYRLNDGAFLALDGTSFLYNGAPVYWESSVRRARRSLCDDYSRSRNSFGQCFWFD